MRQQNGFSTIESLLLVMVAGIIIGAGVLVFRANKSSRLSLDKAAQVSEVNSDIKMKSKITPSTSQPTTPTDRQNLVDDKYLVINEWGIRITLNDKIRDAYYAPNTNAQTVSLKVRSLDNEPACKNYESSQVILMRVPKDQEDGTSPGYLLRDTNKDNGTLIGANFYYAVGAQYPCAEKSENQAKLEDAREGFMQAAKTIQALN